MPLAWFLLFGFSICQICIIILQLCRILYIWLICYGYLLWISTGRRIIDIDIFPFQYAKSRTCWWLFTVRVASLGCQKWRSLTRRGASEHRNCIPLRNSLLVNMSRLIHTSNKIQFAVFLPKNVINEIGTRPIYQTQTRKMCC